VDAAAARREKGDDTVNGENGPQEVPCARHPDVMTTLRCGRCGTPICPKCMVQTPVGARCPKCARLYKLPTFRVSRGYYARAIGTALGMAAVTGLLWGVFNNLVGFFYFGLGNLLLAAGVGYAIGEVVGLSVNRKRGRWLAVIGGAGVAVAYVVNIFTFGRLPLDIVRIVLDLVSVGVGVYVAVGRLR
jgi:hypothetical protein